MPARGSAEASTPEPDLIRESTLTVCTSYPYEPFEFEKDGEVVGFDIDLVGEVAKELDVDIAYVNEDFEDIASGELLNSNFCDIGVAAMSIDGDRARVIDFSSPYFNAAQVMVVQKGSGIKRPQRTWPAGASPYKKARPARPMRTDNAPSNAQIVPYENAEDVDSALSGGTVDAGILRQQHRR